MGIDCVACFDCFCIFSADISMVILKSIQVTWSCSRQLIRQHIKALLRMQLSFPIFQQQHSKMIYIFFNNAQLIAKKLAIDSRIIVISESGNRMKQLL